MSGDLAKTVCCPACHEWYDARAAACYLCGAERPGQNIALIRAVHEDRLNTATSRQMANAQLEARATQQIPSGSLGGRTGPSRPYNVPGYKGLVQSIKSQVFGD